jgi:hypothetical protein
MSAQSPDRADASADENADHEDRRVFLRSLGKWSGAAIIAAVSAGSLTLAPRAEAGRWINRRGGGGGGWVNRGGGGAWANRGGGGGWVNRYGGGGGWVNRVGGGGGWVNRW